MPRLVFISDTHTLHSQTTKAIKDARANILVHCGDFTANDPRTKVAEVIAFADWCAMLIQKEYVQDVVAIAGNHELCFDEDHPTTRRDRPGAPETCKILLEQADVDYLQDSGCEVQGLKFYGTPWTQRFYDWAFQIDTAAQDEAIFEKVPEGIDVLLTHGPPYKIRDYMPRGEYVGSPALREALNRVRPRVHAFGHIHFTYGMTVTGEGVLSINAATCRADMKPKNPPMVIDLEPRR